MLEGLHSWHERTSVYVYFGQQNRRVTSDLDWIAQPITGEMVHIGKLESPLPPSLRASQSSAVQIAFQIDNYSRLPNAM